MDNNLIDEQIVFVTTTLYTKWLGYQQQLIKKNFPKSEIILIDGRSGWPNSWFFWIDELKKSNKKYYIHVDEDFFLLSKSEILKLISELENNNFDLIGCPDGYHQYRGANPVAFNTFFLIGKIDDIRRIPYELKKSEFNLIQINGCYSWMNSLNLYFNTDYSKDFDYKFKTNGGSNFIIEQEPYYIFLWTMKKIGCKFEYLYPFFDERFKSTNPRISETSEDIGIHMWYTRNYNQSFDVHGLPNSERYNLIEKYLVKELHLQIEK